MTTNEAWAARGKLREALAEAVASYAEREATTSQAAPPEAVPASVGHRHGR